MSMLALAIIVNNTAFPQEVHPAAAVYHRLLGNYLAIPGESLGTIRLGETNSGEFHAKFGLTRFVRWPPTEITWDWPEPKYGYARIDYDQPLEFFFCRSGDLRNQKLYAVITYNATPDYPAEFGREQLRLYYRRLMTPERFHSRIPPPEWARVYGEPIVVPMKVYADTIQTHLFHNGLVIIPVLPTPSSWVFGMGVYNDEVCRGGGPRGLYVAFLGRLMPESGKIQFSKTGDVQTKTIGPEPEKIGENDILYVRFELPTPAPRQEAALMIRREYLPSQGEPIVRDIHYTIKPGQISLVDVYEVGWRPRKGEWTVRFSVQNVVLAQATFKNVP